MSDTAIALIVGIPVGVVCLGIIWVYILSIKDAKAERLEEERKEAELINEMITSSKEFVTGQEIPFSNYKKFGGFQSDNKILILEPGFYGNYAQQFFTVKIGMEMVLGYNTFIVKGLNPDDNKILLALKDEPAA